MARLDPHSFADDTHAIVTHIDWVASVDFTAHRLEATATLRFRASSALESQLVLDTRGLAVTEVSTSSGRPLEWSLGDAHEIYGSPLTVQLEAGTEAIRITYRTATDASALQWLEPAQTDGGQQPYLYSQCQAIHARSVLPCQDTPSRRITYSAAMTVPDGLVAVMAAAAKSKEINGASATFHFEMPQTIPPYLFAFAVGALVSKDVSARSRVYAEAGMLDAAAWEFGEVEKHIAIAESLYGPYDWERFDMLVMPPSFPYGGMENPRLTFLTPSLIAGDRSLVNVLAHELAHSWTGNLVTNTNAEHFWLNEGFTVMAERRILEALEGKEMAELHAALGRNELEAAVNNFTAAGTPELTRLRTKLDGIDPDAAFSQVPYEKGYSFLRALEEAAGRPAFDAIVKSWLHAHRFGAVDTDDFIAHFEKHSPGLLEKVNAAQWLDAPGIPSNCPKASPAKLAAVERLAGTVPKAEATKSWSATEWQLFLELSKHRFLSIAALTELDARFGLSTSKNAEVHVGWLLLALESGHHAVMPQVEAFAGRFGRMKYLKPLFKAMAGQPALGAKALALYEKLRMRWHLIAQQTVGRLLGA